MAEILVRNSLGSQVAVKITVTLHESIVKDDKDEGDPKWLLMLGTTHKDKYDNTIPPVAVHNLSGTDIDGEIEKAINVICKDIDWGGLYVDREAPSVISYSPTGQDVDILSDIKISIKDSLPSSGLDLSNLNVTINNGTFTYDITDEILIRSDTFDCDLRWVPKTIIKDTYH